VFEHIPLDSAFLHRASEKIGSFGLKRGPYSVISSRVTLRAASYFEVHLVLEAGAFGIRIYMVESCGFVATVDAGG
jgi:hypothetical protein